MQRGFTLIEILIAMAIFTLIGLASTGLLTTVIDSNDISEERFAKLQLLQRAMITICYIRSKPCLVQQGLTAKSKTWSCLAVKPTTVTMTALVLYAEGGTTLS